MASVLVVPAIAFRLAVIGGAFVRRMLSAMLQMSGIVSMLVSCHTVHLSTPILLKRDRLPSMLRYYDIMCFMEHVGSVMPASEGNLSSLSELSFHDRAVHRQRSGAERSQK